MAHIMTDEEKQQKWGVVPKTGGPDIRENVTSLAYMTSKLLDIWDKRIQMLNQQIKVYRKQNMKLEEISTIRLVDAIEQCHKDLRQVKTGRVNIDTEYIYQI